MMSLLDDFFMACDVSSFTYDTTKEAQQAAHWLLKGSSRLKCIFIIPEGDAPDAVDRQIYGKGECLCVRSRDLIHPNWYAVTTKEAVN
jgi:hypothetical protein